jgi:hypothetical protein
MRQKRLLGFMTLLFAMVFILTASMAKSEITVYDANEQYLGVLSDIYLNLPTSVSVRVFIPSLGKFVRLNSLEEEVTQAHIGPTGTCYETTDCTGTIYSCVYVNMWPWVNKPGCEEGYYTGGEIKTITRKAIKDIDNCECVELPEDLQTEVTAQEFVVEPNLPFTTPVTLPLRYEYETNAKGDYNNDGDVDGSDLAEFADDFGL